MSAKLFLSFRSLVPDQFQSPNEAKCAAYLDNGERCGSHIPEGELQAIRDLHARHSHGSEEGDRELLTQFAKLHLCSERGHNSEQNVTAVVQQWVENKPPSRSADPQTDSDSQLELKFEKTSTPQQDISLSIDQRIIAQLMQKAATKNPGYLYVVTHEAAKGHYKISTQGHQAAAFKTCYPGSVLYDCIQCPDVRYIKQLVLAEFISQGRYHQCKVDACKRTTHREWIESPGDDIRASIKAWVALVEAGYENTQIPQPGFSGEPDRWRIWARDTVKRQDNEAESKKASTISHETSEASVFSGNTTLTEPSAPSTPPTSSSDLHESVSTPIEITADAEAKSDSPLRGLAGKTKRFVRRITGSRAKDADS